MPRKILDTDWKEFDDKSIKDGRDCLFFNHIGKWEVDYLVNKIKNAHPDYSEDQIRTAIRACSKVIQAPRPRVDFVKCVMRGLSIIL